MGLRISVSMSDLILTFLHFANLSCHTSTLHSMLIWPWIVGGVFALLERHKCPAKEGGICIRTGVLSKCSRDMEGRFAPYWRQLEAKCKSWNLRVGVPQDKWGELKTESSQNFYTPLPVTSFDVCSVVLWCIADICIKPYKTFVHMFLCGQSFLAGKTALLSQ